MTGKKRDASSSKKKSVVKKKSKIVRAPLKTKKQTTTASEKDDNIFRIIFDNSPIGIELFDTNGVLVNVNKAGLANYGVSDIMDLKGFNFFEDPMFSEEMKKRLRKGDTVRYEAAFDFDEARELGLFKSEKTGTVFLDMLFAPIRTEKDKRISGYLAQVQDITERKNNEENLKISEERYRMLFNSVNDAVFLHDVTEDGRPGKFIAANDIACNLYGYTKEEFADMSPVDINDPERASDPIPVVKKLFKEKHVLFETVDMTKDGRSMPVEISSHLFEFSGKPMIVSAVRDITERKQTEEALKESEERYHTLFKTANDAILLADIETGIILDANKKSEDLFGMSASELIGLHHTQLHPKEIAEEYRKGFKESEPKEGAVLPEMFIARKDGTVVPVEISEGVVQLKDRKARLGIFRDITKRMEVENQLRESEQRFRGAFENAAVGASMVDLKGRFIKVNKRLCDMLGYSEDELMTKTFSDITFPDDIQIGLENMKKQLAGDSDYTAFEKRYVRKDGQVINVIVSPALIRSKDGAPQHFVGLWQDVTDRKKAEEEIKKSLGEKEVLLKEIHHRVKNNMAIISSLLHLQARYSNDENVNLMFRDSQSRIRSMALVHEKLYQTKDFTNINFREYVEELVGYLMHTHGKKDGDIGIVISIDDFNFNIDTIIPCGLIINEIVTNSLKYAFKDVERPEIGISFNTYDGQDVMVCSDNGVGIPEHIKFPNSDSLGLQIVDMLTLQLRGTVELERNDGTKFVIKFELPKDEFG